MACSISLRLSSSLVFDYTIVGKGGLEPPILSELVPKTSAYTNSATCPGMKGYLVTNILLVVTRKISRPRLAVSHACSTSLRLSSLPVLLRNFVGTGRLELPRVSPYASETYAYTNSATCPCLPENSCSPTKAPRSSCAPSRDRTYDLLLKRQLLYQLSYGCIIIDVGTKYPRAYF
jgi:hypothetical protein